MLAFFFKLFSRGYLMLGFLVLNAMLGCLLFFNPYIYLDYAREIFSFAVVTLLVSAYYFRYNTLFQARIILLATIGYFAGMVKMINPDLLFSPVAIFTQTFEIGVQMFGLTLIALLGAVGGLLFASGSSMQQPNFVASGLKSIFRAPYAVFVFSTILVLITGELSARSYGPLVFNAVYASGQGEGQLLGNLQSIGVVSLAIAIVSGGEIQGRWVKKFLFFLGFYFLGWGIFLRGGRLEVVSGLLAIFITIPATKGRVFYFKFWHYGMVVGAALFMEAWGTLRQTLSGAGRSSEGLTGSYSRLADSGIYFAGTISGIATTFANVLHMFQYRVLDYIYGSSYLDYILRSPPEFIYHNRPEDLSALFLIKKYPSIGGFFELAEAYLNFGIIGCLIIPFIISYFIAICYRKALYGSLLGFVILIAILSVFFRGAWYQTFAFYKGTLTGLILFIGLYLVQMIFPDRKWVHKLPKSIKFMK